jgi:hypothetical protein
MLILGLLKNDLEGAGCFDYTKIAGIMLILVLLKNNLEGAICFYLKVATIRMYPHF